MTCGVNCLRCEIIQCNRSMSKPIIVWSRHVLRILPQTWSSSRIETTECQWNTHSRRRLLQHARRARCGAGRKFSHVWWLVVLKSVLQGLTLRLKLSHLEISTITPVTLKLRGERLLISERSSRTVWCGTHVDRWL